MLVGSRANSYIAIELRWRMLKSFGLSARGPAEGNPDRSAPAAAGAETARVVPRPSWAIPDRGDPDVSTRGPNC